MEKNSEDQLREKDTRLKVFVRVRPFTKKELKKEKDIQTIKISNENTRLDLRETFK